jgi:hypothetical protein
MQSRLAVRRAPRPDSVLPEWLREEPSDLSSADFVAVNVHGTLALRRRAPAGAVTSRRWGGQATVRSATSTLPFVSGLMIPQTIEDAGSAVVLPTVAGFVFGLYLSLTQAFGS